VIRDRGVALRYANALFGAAEKRGVTEAVLSDLLSLQELEAMGPSLQSFLESPSILDEHKEALFVKVLRGNVDEITVQLGLLMLRKGRIQHLPLVLVPFRKLVEAKLGMERAEVLSAIPLDAGTLERMRLGLEQVTGKKIQIVAAVDPSILGGVVVTVGGQVLDSSLRTRLASLREELMQSRVH
jgi:F-type H+-transporting ATPase subunit delta